MKSAFALVLGLFAITSCGSDDGEVSSNPASTHDRACGPTAPGEARKDVAMPILGIHHTPSLTQERYEEVVRRLTNGRSRLESVSDGGIEGLLVHVVGKGDDGFWIVDVWESQEAVDRFGTVVRPIAESVGIEEPLKTYPVHTFLC